MGKIKTGILGLSLFCLIVGVILKIDRSIVSYLGAPESWLIHIKILDHILFPVGALLFFIFIMIHGRHLKQEAKNEKNIDDNAIPVNDSDNK